MTRILLCHNSYKISGGADVFYHEVGRILEKYGHEIAYFSSYEGDVDTEWAEYFPKVIDFKKNVVAAVMQFHNMVYSRKNRAAIEKLVDDFHPDLAHCFAVSTRLTPSILDGLNAKKVPIICSFNDYKHICPNYKLYHHGHLCEECKKGHYYRCIINSCCHNSLIYSTASAAEAYAHKILNIYRKNVHTFLFASEFMANKTEEFWGVGTFRWQMLRNPFDSQKFDAEYCPDGPVLFFGRLIEEKGVDMLIRAAAKLPDIKFRIVGDGPDIKKLKELSIKLENKNVTFTGSKWSSDMDEEIKRCCFVVVPSLWHENYPYVINQSFAYGKPIIGTNRGGIPEMVSNYERGLIYEATELNDLVTKIKTLWCDSEMIKKMGDNAKKYANSEFNDKNLYMQLEDIYNGVLR